MTHLDRILTHSSRSVRVLSAGIQHESYQNFLILDCSNLSRPIHNLRSPVIRRDFIRTTRLVPFSKLYMSKSSSGPTSYDNEAAYRDLHTSILFKGERKKMSVDSGFVNLVLSDIWSSNTVYSNR
jgi:hypothetical protein